MDCEGASPWIEAPWPGWVDLRTSGFPGPNGAARWATVAALLPEVRAYPELLAPMRLLNGAGILTAKVDVFALGREDADPEIAEVGDTATAHGLGSYLDVLGEGAGTASDGPGSSPAQRLEGFVEPARAAVLAFRQCAVGALCSGEIVLRRARLYDRDTFGWTVYASGFGPTPAAARQAWAQALQALAEVFQKALEQPAAKRASSSTG